MPACAVVVVVMAGVEGSRFHDVLHLENTSDDIAFLEVGLQKGGKLLSVAQSSWKIQGFSSALDGPGQGAKKKKKAE